MSKLTVGQEVFVQYTGFDHRGTKTITENKIATIGKKYFTLEGYVGYHNIRFHIDTLKHDSKNSSSEYQVWLSREEYEAEAARKALLYKLSSRGGWRNHMAMEDLQIIDAIFSKYNPEVK